MSDNYKGVYDVRDSYGNVVKNKYCLRITTTVNGVTHRDTFTIEAPSRQKAYDYKVKKIEELKLKYAKGENVQDNMTFAQLVDKWKQTVENKMNKKDSKALSYDTYASYKSSLKNYIIPYLGDKLITNITKGTIRLYLDYVSENYSLSSKTIYNQFSLISSILNYAYQRDFILFNPCDKVEIEKPETPDIEYFTDQQMKLIIVELNKMVEERKEQLSHSIKYSKLDNKERERRENKELLRVYQKRLFILLSIVTGSRRGEALGLRWNDINLDDCAFIEFKGTQYFETGKGAQYKDKLKNNSKLKKVYIEDHIIPYILELKELQNEVIKQFGWKNTGYVFITLKAGKNCPPGSLANGDSFSDWFSGWCLRNKEKLALSDSEAQEAHVHMLRHSSISYLLNNNIDIKTTAEIAGHKDANMTANRYGHSYDDNKIKASKLFSELFTGEQ